MVGLRAVVIAGIAGVFGCADTTVEPAYPSNFELLAAKGAGGGGDAAVASQLVADVVPDPAFVSADPQLASTCAGEVTSAFHVFFRHSGCLIVRPTGSAYPLTDDLTFWSSKIRKGLMSAMRLTGQDVIGASGIMHETDFWTYNPPVTVNRNGFVIHVHQDRVPVWRLSGHTGGTRVTVIGTIAIGDLVYRQP